MRFFYGGPLSQWAWSPFTLQGLRFFTAEHWMMWSKATLFGDTYAACAILETESAETAKAVGKVVRNFDDALWVRVAKSIVFAGNMAKFCQNPELREYLRETGDKELVEASPTDCRWGVGLSEMDPRIGNRKNWRGTNWLGQVLMDVRSNLCG